MLTAHYEALRPEALEVHTGPRPMYALAVLLRRGMAAWMQALAQPSAAPVAAQLDPYGDAGPPGGLQRSMVEILTTMALATVNKEFA